MKHLSKESLEKEALLEGIRNIAVDGYASSATNRYLTERVRNHFDSWADACKAAGVRPLKSKPQKNYDRRTVAQEPKRDCQFYIDDMRCEGLNRMYCKFEDCNFYKPNRGAKK